MLFERPFEARNLAHLTQRSLTGSPNMVAVTFGGTWLTRMPSQTFNLGHEAARESDQRFSALRNCGKDRRPTACRKKTERGRKKWNQLENFWHSVVSLSRSLSYVYRFPSDRYIRDSQREPSMTKLATTELQDDGRLSIIPVSIWSLSRPFEFP